MRCLSNMLRPSATLAAVAALALAAGTAGAQGATGAGTPPAGASASGATPAASAAHFLAQFDASMSKFIALAQAMPAEKYAWSPGGGTMSVAKVYAHVAHYNYRYPATAMGVAAPAGVKLDTLEQITDKAQIVALLRRTHEHVRQAVRGMPESQLARQTTLYGEQVPQWAVLLQLVAHMNEHLGQSIAYARMNGVVPPWSQ